MSVFNEFEKEYQKKSLSEHSEFLPFAKTDVYYRPINTGEQKRILKAIESRKEHLIAKVYMEVLQEIVTDWGGLQDAEDFPKNIYMDDRNYLLIMARGVSKGSEIKFNPTCPRCEEEAAEEMVIDLQKVDVEPLPDDLYSKKINILDGEFSVKLTVSTRADEIERDKFAKNNKKDYSSNSRADSAFLSKAMMIDSVEKDGEKEELPFSQKVKFMDLLLSEDMEKIDNYLEEISEYGFPNTVDYSCQNCGYETEVPVDLSDFLMRS